MQDYKNDFTVPIPKSSIHSNLIFSSHVSQSDDHMERVVDSKQSESENVAPKCLLAKDHKKEGGFRPVVSRCSSESLGLSNTLSDLT